MERDDATEIEFERISLKVRLILALGYSWPATIGW